MTTSIMSFVTSSTLVPTRKSRAPGAGLGQEKSLTLNAIGKKEHCVSKTTTLQQIVCIRMSTSSVASD